MLDRIVVGDAGAVEGGLEIGLGMGAAEEMPAGLDLMERLHRLPIVAEVDALGEHMHGAELVEIHHEFLVRGREPALQPAGGVQHEIRARKHRRQQRLRALIGRLRVGNLGGAERAAGAERHVHAPRELARAIDRQRRLRRAEGRRARLHGQRRDESAEDHRRAGPRELAERRSGQHLGQHLRQRAGDRHRAHRAGQDERA